MSNLAATAVPLAARPVKGYDQVALALNASRQPDVRRSTRCIVTTRIDCDTGDVGTIQVQISPNGSGWTTLQSHRQDFSVTGALGVGGTSRNDVSHTFDVPAGYHYRLLATANAGTPIFTLVNVMEAKL